MSQQCPKCGTTYGITPGLVGRTFTCKNCSSAVIVTHGGVALATLPPAPPPPHEFGKRRKEEAAPPLQNGYHAQDQVPGANDRRTVQDDASVREYLAFRKLILPVSIRIVFWVLIGAVCTALVLAAVVAFGGPVQEKLLGIALIVIGLPLCILLVRISCELIVLLVRIHGDLADIKTLLARRRE